MNNQSQNQFSADTQVGVFVYFSQLMDRPVVDKNNVAVGHLYDIVVKPEETYPLSISLIIRKGFPNRKYAVVKWESIEEIDKEITLKVDRSDLNFSEIHDNREELTLRRDILDQQVVDTYNHKVIRVNDIHLLTVDHSLMIAHVDISLRGLLRRLRYEKLVDFWVRVFNKNAEYLRIEHLIPWKYIQPLTINPVSMTIKVNFPQKKLTSIPAADFGEIFADLSIKHQIALFKSIDINTKAKIFTNIDFKNQRLLIEELDDKQSVELLNTVPSDEATDFLEKLPKDLTDKYLKLMENKTAKKLSELLGYSSDSAGGLMTKDYMAFTKGTPVEAVIKSIKEREFKIEPIQFVYIVDEQNHFIGTANYRHLLMANPLDPVEKAAFAKAYFVRLDSSVKEVAYLMEKYKYYSIAVVDENNVLLGIITVDDILSQLISIAWRRLKKIKTLPKQQ
jgi:CBS domain-containing protein